MRDESFQQINTIIAAGLFCCYQGLIRPMQTGTVVEKQIFSKNKSLHRNKNSLEALWRHLLKAPSHAPLQKVRG